MFRASNVYPQCYKSKECGISVGDFISAGLSFGAIGQLEGNRDKEGLHKLHLWKNAVRKQKKKKKNDGILLLIEGLKNK